MSLVLAGVSSSATGAPPDDVSPRGLSTPQLIERAVSRGEIGRGRADLFLARAFADPGRVPDRFRSDVPWRGTLPLLQLQQRLARAPESPERAEARELLAAPGNTSCGGQGKSRADSEETENYFIEYDGAKLTASPDGLGIAEYKTALETSWTTEVISFGWPRPLAANSPPSGKYHVRIDALGNGLYGFVSSFGTYAGPIGNHPDTPWTEPDGYASCLVLNEDYSSFPQPFSAALESTAAHELHHGVQFALGTITGSNAPDQAFIEGSATWMEDEVFDAANDNYNYLWPPVASSLGQFSTADTDEYAMWVILRALTESYGAGIPGGSEDVMQRFWESTSRSSVSNQLPALKAALSAEGTSLAQAYHSGAIALKFDKACSVADPYPYCLEEGPAYVASQGLPAVHASIPSIGGSVGGSIRDDFASNWVALPLGNVRYDVGLTNTSVGGQLRASVACDAAEGLSVFPLPNAVGKGRSSTLRGFDPFGCISIALVITNEAETAANPSSSEARSYLVATGETRTLTIPTPQPFTIGRLLRVSWSSSGAASFEIQRRSASFRSGFGGYGTWLTTEDDSASFDATPARTYCFRGRATDERGLVESAFGPERCSAIPVNDRSLSRRGGWSARTGSGYYLGTYLQTRNKGARLLLDGVRARRIALVATKCASCGTVKVFLGGTLLREVSLRASTTSKRRLISIASFSSTRTGRVRVVVASRDGKLVRIEGLGISAV